MSSRSVLPSNTLGFLFEDGVYKEVTVVWSRGMTVLDGLERASQKTHGIMFRKSGDRGSTFVTEIDGEANDASGNWMYRVNGEFATVGSGEYVLKPYDVVEWVFVPFDPKAL